MRSADTEIADKNADSTMKTRPSRVPKENGSTSSSDDDISKVGGAQRGWGLQNEENHSACQAEHDDDDDDKRTGMSLVGACQWP